MIVLHLPVKALVLLPLMRLSLFFFFLRCGNQRDLLSFPTRRSSELISADDYAAWAEGLADPSLAAVEREFAEVRSEEHTSELQSRRDLVCRLLLEKKNDYSRLECSYPQ